MVQARDREVEALGHQQAQQVAEQGLGQGEDRVEHARQDHQPKEAEEGDAAEPDHGRGHGQAQEGEHGHVLDEVVAGQDPAQVLVAGVELDEGVERHHEHAAEHAVGEHERAQAQAALQVGQQEQARGHAQGRGRDEPGLDVVAGGAAGRHRAEHQAQPAQAEQGLGHHRVGLAHPGLEMGPEGGQEHLVHGPEHGQAHHGQPDGAVAQEQPQVVPQIAGPGVAGQVQGEPGVASAPLGQGQGRQELHRGPGDEHPAAGRDGGEKLGGPGLPAVEQVFEEHGIDHPAQQDGHDGHGLHRGVGPGQVLLAHHLLDVAVLGRGIHRALGGQQEGHGEGGPEQPGPVAEQDGHGQGQGHEGAGLDDRVLGKAVRDEPRGREQEDEGQQDEPVDHGGEQDLGGAVEGLEHRVLDDDLVAQVGDRVEQHHGHEGQEATGAEQRAHGSSWWRRVRPGRGSGSPHRAYAMPG